MNPQPTSIEKVLDILCSFDLDHQELSVQEISERHYIPLSTAYKYLNVLLKKGFLAKDTATKKYSLGLTLFKIGNQVTERMKLLEVAVPHMNALSKRSRETVTLTVLYGWNSLCIEKIETPKRIQLMVEKGRSIPLNAGASQMILLAYQEDFFIDALIEDIGLPAFTDNTMTNPGQLKRGLSSIRKQGFAFSDGEYESGAAAVAAPIFDHKGKVVAGLSIVGPRERITGDNSHQLIDLVKGSARKISDDL